MNRDGRGLIVACGVVSDVLVDRAGGHAMVSESPTRDLFNRALLTTYEIGLLLRAELDAKITRITLALQTDDGSWLDAGDIAWPDADCEDCEVADRPMGLA